MESMFLFGAGASIDGGLSDAYSLTEKIYSQLRSSRDQDASKVFGLIISKVLSRKVREGGSPFDRVNVEEVYDGLRRLARKNSDLLSEFVTGWDPAIGLLRSRVTSREVEGAFATLLSSFENSNFGARLRPGGSQKVVELLNQIGNQGNFGDFSSVELSLLRALVDSLRYDEARIEYFEKTVSLVKRSGGDIATLNYDLIAEASAERNGFSYDYGLDKWNTERIVSFKRSSSDNLRIIKLHGSLNWFNEGDADTIEVNNVPRSQYHLPQLVFGGASDKLRIDGPFLQLRHEFQNRLLKVNHFIIVGYSFQDEHLNSIIRRWTNTRRSAKLIVVNPMQNGDLASNIGYPYTEGERSKREKLKVDLIHIRKGAADAVDDLSAELDKPINLDRELRNGVRPHIDFNVVQ